jgi:hypothetical protein
MSLWVTLKFSQAHCKKRNIIYGMIQICYFLKHCHIEIYILSYFVNEYSVLWLFDQMRIINVYNHKHLLILCVMETVKICLFHYFE